jgi:serine/threonine-protein kinase
MAVGFDLEHSRIAGDPVATNISARPDPWDVKAFVNLRGDLTYVGSAALSHAVLLGRGRASTVWIRDEREYDNPRYSPDGKRVAISITAGGHADIWIYNIASGSFERLTTVGADNSRPEWTRDGRHVLFRSSRAGASAIWWQMVDGSAPAERLTPEMQMPVQEAVLSPDDKTLMYRVDSPNRARDIYVMSLTGDRTPREFLATEFDELGPRFSPDGRWVTYVSNESGRDEVYVRPFPGAGGRVLISAGVGGEPVWSRDGRQIYYRTLDDIMVASLTFSPGPSVIRRDTVFTGVFVSNRFHAAYDVAPDGRLLLLEPSQKEVQPTIVLNWRRVLETRFGAR